jgi:peptidoglycan/xylan/chitin deacetylase (PgdA/CDA1 family)
VITFDDGWRNQFVYGFPIIEKYHYPATYFVFTDAVNKRGFMTWDNLRVLLDAGMSIGSHTRTHPFLTQVSDEKQLEQEIVESRHILEHKLHIRVDDFAYPFGQFNQHTVALVKRAGYASARGDFYSGKQSLAKLYGLSAMNVPTTLERFVQVFP